MKRTIQYLFICIVMLALLASASRTAPSVISASEKISASVMEASATGQSVDAIILLAQDASLSMESAHQLTSEERHAYVYETLYRNADNSQHSLRTWLEARGISYRAYYIVNAIQAELSSADITTLAQRSDVARIITNPTVHLDIPEQHIAETIQSIEALPYGLTTINADDVWSQGITGQGIVLAGQDTGYDWDHEALINSYRGWDGSTADHDYNWHDAIHSEGGDCGADSLEPCDDHWHGTHTMGTMVGDNGVDDRIGVAPSAEWIGCRNMDQGAGTPTTYIECFEFFLAPYPVSGTAAQGDPSKAPHIINNSWSCPESEGCDAEHTELMEQVVENVRAAGIMVVVSATNEGSSCDTVTRPPAIFNASYSIAATDASDTVAGFSSRGMPGSGKPNLSAPGVSVYSSVPNNGYGNSSGTSMASPHVAGAAGLLWSAHPELIGDITRTEDILNTTAKPLYSTQCGDAADAVPNSVYGWGRVDIEAAVNIATITGTVTSSTGMPLSGVLINATPVSGTVQSTTSQSGTYSLLIPAGTYTLTATLDGYIPVTFSGIVLGTGESMTQNIVMTPFQAIEGLDVNIAPYWPVHRQTSVYTATVSAGSTPITYTWAFTETILTGNPITQTLLWDISRQRYTLTITATNQYSTTSVDKVIEVLAPNRLYLPFAVRQGE